MKLLSLKLKNFRQHADTELRFPEQGLIGVIGANESGKSTLIEAITWALFGARATRGKVDSIRWKRAVARQTAQVELVLEVGGNTYRIHRTENEAKVYEGDSNVPIVTSISHADSKIPELIGMDLDEFSATYLCRQKDLNALQSMGGVERRQFVLRVMGVGTVDDALQYCRRQKNDLAKEKEGLEAGLGSRDSYEQAVAEAREQAKGCEGRHADAVDDLAQSEELHTSAQEALAEADQKKARHQELQRKLEEARKQRTEADEEITRLGGKIHEARQAQERIAPAERELSELPRLREKRDELKEARARKAERKRLRESITRQEGELRKAEEQLGNMTPGEEPADPTALKDKLGAKREQYESIRKEREQRRGEAVAAANRAAQDARQAKEKLEKLEDLGEEGTCPTCQQALGDAFGEVIGHYRREREQAEKDAAEFQRTVQTLSEPPEQEKALQREVQILAQEVEDTRMARARWDQARQRHQEKQGEIEGRRKQLAHDRATLEQIPDADVDEDHFTQVESRIRELEELQKRTEGDRAKAQGHESLQEDRARWTEKLKASETAEEEAKQGLRDLAFSTEAYAETAQAAETARKVYEEAKVTLARTEEALKAAQARTEQAEKALEGWESRSGRLKEVAGELRVHERTAERLNDFRTAMASTIRPELEELTSAFIHTLTDGRHEGVSLTEDFDVILQEGGLDQEVVSGGAEDITSIALRLAISHMIAARAGHPLSLLIMDEPYGSLDEVRRRNVTALLERLKGTFAQVLLITHVDEVKDTVDYPVHVEFDEAKGKSQVTGAEPVEEQTESEPVALVEWVEVP